MAGKTKVSAHKRKGKAVVAHTRKTGGTTKFTAKSGKELQGKTENATEDKAYVEKLGKKSKMGPIVKC